MKKDRVVLKDYVLSVLSAGATGLAIFMVFIPLILWILGKSTGTEFPAFMYFMSGTLESVGAVIAITHIVLGALVIQYMRFYMFMGVARGRAFWRIMAVEAVTVAVSVLFLFIVGTVVSLISPNLAFKSVLSTCLMMAGTFVLTFGTGCISSSLSTTCRPPLSVGLIIAVLAFFIWLIGRISSLAQAVVEDSNEIKIIITSVLEGQEVLISLGIGIVMCLISFFVYKLKISQIKSTSIS